jgi:hypothetical protein
MYEYNRNRFCPDGGGFCPLFMGAFVVSQLGIELPARYQTGDSSLSGRSVNWMGAIALTAAILICLI